MHIQKKDNYTLVSIDTSFDEFNGGIDALKSDHLVLEVSENLNIDDAIISLLLKIASAFKENGMSFVLVKTGIDVDNFPESLNIVPTMQEAEDVLEMEAIERDLGF